MYWKRSNPNCSGNRPDKAYQIKNSLSVCRLLLLQQKPKLGRTKSSTGPHAAGGPRLDIAALVLPVHQMLGTYSPWATCGPNGIFMSPVE